jgi:phage host-nuclease inhibitor protein Gam
MARRKVTLDPAIQILTTNDADAVLAELAQLGRDIDEIEGKLNADIDTLKRKAAAEAAPLQARMGLLENALAVFGLAKKAELFSTVRSVALNHGTIGFRRSTAIKPQSKWTWEMVLGKLKELGMRDGIRPKEEVNRDALAEWPDKRLNMVGCRRDEKDTFYYEVTQEELVQSKSAVA